MTEKELLQGFSIKDKSACVIGCGGLGCNIAVHLIGAGIGRLILCDFDTVSLSNLNRQFLYTKKDIGESKVKAAKKRLMLYSDETQIECYEKKILTDENLAFAESCDIILLAVDNAEARKAVQVFAEKNNIPLVCGGIDGFYGVAYLYVPNCSPCPDCAGLNENSKATHSVSAAAGIIGSAQAALATKYLLTEDISLAGNLLIYDENSFSTLKIKPAQSCPICKKIILSEVIR